MNLVINATAIVTRLPDRKFQIEFFKNGEPFQTRVWKSSHRARMELQKAGLIWERKRPGYYWPLGPGEKPVTLSFEQPVSWFWSDK